MSSSRGRFTGHVAAARMRRRRRCPIWACRLDEEDPRRHESIAPSEAANLGQTQRAALQPAGLTSAPLDHRQAFRTHQPACACVGSSLGSGGHGSGWCPDWTGCPASSLAVRSDEPLGLWQPLRTGGTGRAAVHSVGASASRRRAGRSGVPGGQIRNRVDTPYTCRCFDSPHVLTHPTRPHMRVAAPI